MRPKTLSPAALVFALALAAGCRSAPPDTTPPDRDTNTPPPANAAASPAAPAPGAAENRQPPTENAGASEPGRGPEAVNPNVSAAPATPNTGAAAKPQASRSWRVFIVSGAWVVEGGEPRPLARGDALRPGSVVRLRPERGQPEYVVVIDSQSSRTRRLECEPVEQCARGLTVPDVPVSKSTFAHVIDTALDLLSRNPKVYINPISRGGGVREAVLLLEDGGTDLSPALGRLTPARHTLEIAPVASGAPPDAKTVTVEFKRDARRPEPIRADGLRPGLYRLTLDKTAGGDSPDADAWVVVSAPADYRRANARFREAVAITDGWGGAVDGDVARGFLRAYLEHLAARGARD
ncbi:MAG: hypothetical protein ABW250_25015 [Pyrinomonadaceae bacterium]